MDGDLAHSYARYIRVWLQLPLVDGYGRAVCNITGHDGLRGHRKYVVVTSYVHSADVSNIKREESKRSKYPLGFYVD